MTSYTDVFGGETLAPSDASYSSLNLTVNTTLNWPYNYSGTGSVVSKVIEVTCTAGIVLTLPSATEVSNGEDTLIRNVGSNTLTVNDAAAGVVTSIAAGAAVYLYLKSNATLAGTWGVVTYGTGTSAADATTLAGSGLLAIGTTLNSEFSVFTSATGITVDSTYRAQLINYTGGSGTITFDAVTNLVDGFFVLIRNSGTGTLTLDGNASETIDGALTVTVQPGESTFVASSGAALFTVGLGRSTQYQFTQLTKDLTAGGTITLSSSESANKLLTFIGTPGAGVNVVVPNIVAVYYVYNNLSTAQSVTVKTAAGSGAAVTQTGRSILFCDGTNVLAAQTVAVSTALPMLDGSATNPSLYFQNQTNTGLYRSGTDMGVSVNGASVGLFSSTGWSGVTTHAALTATHGATGAIVGTTNTQTLTNKTLTTPVLSGTVSGTTAGRLGYSSGTFSYGNGSVQRTVVNTDEAQTLTNKTIVAANNTLTTAASGNLTSTNVNAALAELQGDIDTINTTITNIPGNLTIWVPAAAMTPQFTNGASVGIAETATNDVMLHTLDFDTAAVEYAQFEIRMPKSWNEGTVTFEPIWSHAATTTNFGVTWSLAASAFSNDDALDFAFAGAQTSVDTGGTTNDLYKGPVSSAITVQGTAAEQDVVKFRISRAVADAGDTMGIDARLHGVTIFYTTNAVNDA